LLIALSERGLTALEFAYKPDHAPAEQRTGWMESKEQAAPVVRELEEYFTGTRREFTVALDLHGTDFQRACWQQLRRIPYGETRTYLDIAHAVSSPGAVRAVGQANHYNPVAIIVPCHRVINTTGKLGGYGGGLDVKAKLLRLEGADVPELIDRGQETWFS
jgi:methylated-DNA-[protein]-cysteine S-methyltransferase